MRKNSILLLLVFLLIIPVSSCSNTNAPTNENASPNIEESASEQTLDLPPSSVVPNLPPDNDLARNDTSSVDGYAGVDRFFSLKQSYYNKYRELAEEYGTHSLYDVKYGHPFFSGRSYLNGVCVVNFIDFNGDGVLDLFVVYSNGQMKRFATDNSRLEIFDFPSKDTYEMEIWTYEERELKLLLHETSVSAHDSSLYSYRDPDDLINLDYRFSITIFENEDGFPVIQKYHYNENRAVCEYENIYFSGETIIKDKLSCKDQVFRMNDSETTWDVWVKNVAGYDKILLSALLANSWGGTSAHLQEVYGMEYNHALVQTERSISYLSVWDEAPSWFVAEGGYISLYLKELYRSNMLRCELEEAEKVFFDHHYALYDIDQNGIPELVLFEGSSGAGTHFHFYTIVDGEVIYCGMYGRTSLFVDNDGGLVAFHRRMNFYFADLLTLEGTIIEATFIAEGTVGGGEPYPALDDFGYEGFSYLAFCPPDIPLVFYTYSISTSLG